MKMLKELIEKLKIRKSKCYNRVCTKDFIYILNNPMYCSRKCKRNSK